MDSSGSAPTKSSKPPPIPKTCKYPVKINLSPTLNKMIKDKAMSNVNFTHSTLTVVDLITPQDHRSIRVTFIRHVYTTLASLLVFTAITISIFCLFYNFFDWTGLLIGLGATLALTVPLSIFTYWTNFDFTELFHLYHLALLSVPMLVSVILYGCIISPTTTVLFNVVLTIILLIFLAMTTQMVVGGGRLQEFPNRRYIRAGLALYFEVMAIYFFMPLVRLTKSHHFSQSHN